MLLGFAGHIFAMGILGPAEEVAQGSQTEGCHGCQTPWMAVAGSGRLYATHKGTAARESGRYGHGSRGMRDAGWQAGPALILTPAPIYHVHSRAAGKRIVQQ